MVKPNNSYIKILPIKEFSGGLNDPNKVKEMEEYEKKESEFWANFNSEFLEKTKIPKMLCSKCDKNLWGHEDECKCEEK